MPSASTRFSLASPGPRYRQLRAILANEIREGLHPVGALLPPEPQLCQRFGVSRHTLREAVRELCESGLVSRHQGVGTRVNARIGQARYVAAMGSLQELMQYTRETRIERLSHRWVDADEALARQLRCAIGERWLEIETCRYPVPGDPSSIDEASDDKPLVHMHVYLRPGCEGALAELDDGNAWVFGLVEKYGGERIVDAHQVVGATAIPAASARILGVKSRSPGLRVQRYYLGLGGRLLSVSLNIYPADRFELSTHWRLQKDAPLEPA